MNRSIEILGLALTLVAPGCLTAVEQESASGAVDVEVANCIPPNQASGQTAPSSCKFTFADFDPASYGDLPRIDAAGVPLIATSVMERDPTLEYTNTAPRTGLLLPKILRGSARLTRMWKDDFARLPHHSGAMLPNGQRQTYVSCDGPSDDSVEPSEQNLPCMFQRVTWRDALRPVQAQGSNTPDQQMQKDQAAARPYYLGPRTGTRWAPEITAPERLLIRFSEPAGFPNGRLPWEQINDKVFAFGFLPLEANHMTLDQLHMNPYRNDVPFPVQADGRGAFPYLAAPHGTVHGGAGRPAY